MTTPAIPYSRWSPLAVTEVGRRFAGAPFTWGLAGGYTIEQFVGHPIRAHGDIDIVVFRNEQLMLQRWLSGWQLFAADPPGALRPWRAGEALPYGIHDIWGHERQSDAWQLQIMLRRANARHTGFEDSLRHEEPGKQCAPWRSTDVSCPDPWKRACLIPYERGSIVEACRATGSS